MFIIKKQEPISSQNFKLRSAVLSLAFIVNDTNVLDMIEKNNLALQQTKILIQSEDLKLLNATISPYSWLFSGSVFTQKDNLRSLSLFTKSDFKSHGSDLQFDKKWTSGFNSSIKYSHLQSGAFNGYASNVFSVGLEKSIYPYFSSANAETISLEALEMEARANKIDLLLSRRKIIRDQLEKFGQIQIMKAQILTNTELLKKYESIVKSIQRKKANNFSVAGELEQALAEMKSREINLSLLQISFNQMILNFKNENNLMNDNLEISGLSFVLLEKFEKEKAQREFQLREIQLNRLQIIESKILKEKSASKQYESIENSNKPDIAVFATYQNQGLDPDINESFRKSQTTEFNKYQIGLKLTHRFDGDFSNESKALKYSQQLLAAKNRMNSEMQILLQVKLAQQDVIVAYDQYIAQTEIFSLRNKVINQMTLNYNQGRIDISLLFDAHNKMASSEINRVDTINDFRLKQWDLETLLLTSE